MIKNIIFDMGEVLLQWRPKEFLKEFNLSEEETDLVLNTVFKSYRWQLMDYGYYKREQDFLDEIKPLLPEKLFNITSELVLHWEDHGLIPIEGSEDLVRDLKDKGYNLALLSNAGPRQPEYWKVLPVSKYFDDTVVSAHVKKYKPCTDIFEYALKKFGYKAEETVFIDDNASNCAGAFLAGLTPIVFINTEDCRKRLSSVLNTAI